ncbi:PIG-L family deacetylase [Aquimarina brevivitae]|uniref:GlcNAc-PI de-N-acetylase n=1 Tax=Aquimarina brevivitae TaxID=323412 RepID=A0A4Q7NU45_9FLAO|nr:PIG-L family deacetylase [Aquimarina brevivitae]RZS90667.1 GlcNAc-PI de-N-acetylase [Aquimarina brevivitae]
MYRIVLLASFMLFNLSVKAQKPKKPNSAEIYQSIKKLNFLGSVLYIAAHPDDENTRLISYMANEAKARTAYLSLTRGDGGQNLIGPEIRELLGVIRTQELLAARKIDGGNQLFTRANDFGYSKHPDETLAIWNKEEVLADVVWAIRQFRPDVIINRFDHRTPGSTHGHHTSSAILSVEAFDKANDKSAYPSQLKEVDPWQPKRLFFNTSWWFYGGRENFEKADKSNLLAFDIGTYYPTLGLSNTEIASLSRSQHKSQGFGSTGSRGSSTEYIELIKGNLPKDKSDVFEGVNTTWSRVEGGEKIGKILTEVQQNYDFKNPSKSIPQLIEAYKLIKSLKDEHWRTIKLNEIQDIITAAAGLYLEAVSSSPLATKGSEVEVTFEAINRSDADITLQSFTIEGIDITYSKAEPLQNNQKINQTLKGKVAATIPYTNAYWLKEKGSLGMYKVADPNLIGKPETEHQVKANFTVNIAGTPITFSKDVVYKTTDPVKGEVYRPLEIIPQVAVGIKDKVIIYANGAYKTIPVTVKAGKDNVEGTLKLNIPQGWQVSPQSVAFELAQKGEEKTINFTLYAPKQQSEGYIKPVAMVNNKEFSDEMITIDYDHIPFQTVFLPAESKVVKLDITKKGENIGYIAGAGDVVPESLAQIGYQVTLIDPETISEKNLQNFDAVVMGIRAYNTVDALKFKQPILLSYVKNGGNLIVQYNTNRRLKVDTLGPYPLTLSRDRVTDENAAITFLVPDHPVLNTPNKLSQADFEGWVQERGLYFPGEWSDDYQAILTANDKGETPKNGALLVAKYGEGYYVYTGLSFFREFPAGVSGAYRLFANLLSLGK